MRRVGGLIAQVFVYVALFKTPSMVKFVLLSPLAVDRGADTASAFAEP